MTRFHRNFSSSVFLMTAACVSLALASACAADEDAVLYSALTTLADQAVDTVGEPVPITIENTHHKKTIELSSCETSPPFYVEQFAAPVTISPNGSFTVFVRFEPTSAGTFTDELYCAIRKGEDQSFPLEATATGDEPLPGNEPPNADFTWVSDDGDEIIIDPDTGSYTVIENDGTSDFDEDLRFEGSLSTDPDGDLLSYSWSVESDNDVADSGESLSGLYVFSENLSYQVSLTVTDSHGASATKTITLTVISEEDFNQDPDFPIEPVCGDGFCDVSEGCSTCSIDCGVCGSYLDDTHASLQSHGNIEDLSGQTPGYSSFQWEASDTALDVRGGAFVVANSGNDTGDACETGTLPTNRYPIKIYYAPLVSFVGGIVHSDISLAADWDPLYCNSAAILFNKGSSQGIVDGTRIAGAWDAVRLADGSDDLVIKNTWFTGVRDDVVENDDYMTMEFRDNLVDGTFQGISVRDDDITADYTDITVTVSASLMRIQSFLYKGSQRFGAMFKRSRSNAPMTEVHDSVIAVDSSTSNTFSTQWEHSWRSIKSCSNNQLLWLSDSSLPSSMRPDLIPSCFEVYTGQEARERWQQAKQNWINCHPRLERVAGDPASVPEACMVDTFGGYAN